MDKKEARVAIHRALLSGNGILLQTHAQARAVERGFTSQDALWVISGGSMKGDPTDHKLGFECVMKGTTADGKILEVPIIVNTKANCIIVKTLIGKGFKK